LSADFPKLPSMGKKRTVNQRPTIWWKKSIDKILILFLFGIFFLLSPGQNKYFLQPIPSVVANDPPVITLPTPAPYPVNRTGILPQDVSSEGIVILDADSGVYLYKKNEEEVLAPASTTKILTALVALDHWKLDDVLTVKSLPDDGQMMGLVLGEKMTFENLLYGMLIHSGNDAAWTIADNYPGGMPAFIVAMNAKSSDLHLVKSVFTNPVGYDDPGHKMTPTDLARLAMVALTNKTIAKMVAIPQITISDITHTYFHSLKNVNELLGKIPGVGGIKTGWTTEAGENLVTLVERGGHKVIIVVLKSKDRFGDTSKLIDWVFGNYEWQVYGQEK
jgi:serine-type D-Ala-D-Ala carboxypeptidase (penicillin-binding protein 5/6)